MASHSLRARLLALLLPLATLAILLAGAELYRPYAWFLFVPALAISTVVIAALATHAIHANARLRQVTSERRIFAALIENSSDFIGIADPSGRPVYGNPAARRMVSLPPETRIEDTQIQDYYPPDQQAFVQNVIIKGMVEDGHWQGETYFRNWQTGAAIPVSDSHFMIRDPESGAVLGMGTITRDITARKQLENELAAKSANFERAQSVAQIGSWRLDVQRNELRWSAEAYRLFGISPSSPMTYEGFLDCVHPDDRAEVDRQWTAALGGAPYDIEHRLLVDGQVKWVREKADLEFDDRGALVGGIGITQDITERKRLEDEIRNAQERIELALNGADLAAWDWNIETGEVVFSARWAEMRGYAPDEIKPRVESWRDGIHPDDLPRVYQAIDDHASRRTTEYECEFRARTKSGSWLWVLDRGKVFARDANDRPTRMLGTELDITRRKETEIGLRVAHETTSGILSISADAIISIDENQRIEMFNEGAEKIFGYTKAEAIGAHLEMLLPERSRSIHHRHVERFAAGPDTAKQMANRSGELFGLRKNGDEFPAEAAISKLEVGGHKILTATVRDVTDQRRIEHEQRFLAEAGPILASSLDYERTLDRVARLAVREIADLCIVDIVSVGGELRRLKATCRDPAMAPTADGLMRISFDPTRPYLTKSVVTTHEPMLIERVSDEIIASFAQTEEHLELLRAFNPTSFLAVPLIAHGKLVGAIALASSGSSRRLGIAELGLVQELARRAALAIESARLYTLAQRAIQARDDVLGVVAHDLRNPLNAILLQADMLTEQKAGDILKRSAARMNRLIQDILDVTRLDAGQLTVYRQRVSMVQLLLDVVEAQRPVAEAARLALVLDVAPDVPDVWADHDRLLQICENLISNALKFTVHGTVTIGAAPRDGDVMVWVRDTGCGVAPESLPHIFDRFWKSDTDVRRGAGLGLAIVKGLVEAHGGRAWAESTQGTGTCFYFTIPQAAPIDTRETATSHA